MYVNVNSLPQPNPFAYPIATAFPAFIWLNKYASVGSSICPHNTFGKLFNASIAPSPVPQPVIMKSTALEFINIADNNPACTYVKFSSSGFSIP